MWLWEERGDGDIDETEGTEGESFIGDKSVDSFTWKVNKQKSNQKLFLASKKIQTKYLHVHMGP